MADNKKYYYLKLKENFFESDEAIILESMPDGYIYSNILLKLYLRSLKNDGLLMFNNLIPYNAQMLATITRHQIGTVEKAIQIFRDLQLIEILDNGAIYMTNIQNFVGKSSSQADYMRNYREKKGGLTNVNQNSYICEREIEIDIEKEKEKDKERELDKEKEYIAEQSLTEYLFPDWLEEKYVEQVKKGNPKNFDYRIPIAYLNQKTNSNYKFVDSNVNLVKARLRDGYNLDDFKAVVDKKCGEWGNSDMAKYLRPSTLFNASKFESYLNQPEVAKSDYYQKQQGQRFSQAELDELKKPDPKYGF
ncbi:primosome component and related proteins [Streptococcus pyogenes]|uniref:phage replisome organizer N-terminal domain-containing protein n=1 Tax=Streptococcus pyogenes TaxID=1314 RepID=UPI00109D7D48|nr:phage replisome organizer N-terminal domain-containing protein [Streptococcus pyogenes]VGR84344.1 DNA replication protein dnaD [Streptococcus pyogenes]VGV09856.1 primosome component and related proteins [Streptococcus pyogenes]VGV31411.1 primosome component and related proteins [Streptococcus pyogenes]VGV61053.1 primosome component and related proteins [Streptococcus pyogenes]VHA69285.1 primosome component and related proteins [Streptococcus pyogenes]